MTRFRVLLRPLDRLAAFLDSGKASQQPGAVRVRRGLAAVTLVFALLASFRSIDRGGMLSPGAVLLAVMAFALYSNRGGRFVRDWLPVFLAFLCYGLVAKAVPDLGLQVHYTPQIDADRILGLGHLPTTWLQSHLYHGDTGPLEFFSLLMYLSHFVAPVALACLIWLRWPGRGFNDLLYGIVMVSFLAEIAFLLAPTAPPWLAAEHGLIPPVDPVLKNSLTDLGLNELAKAKGDASLYNVVAAVPSLHAAWPLIGLLVIRKYHLPRWLFWTQLGLTLGVCFAIVYTGEHYVVDILAGFAFALAAWWLVQWALAAGREQIPVTAPAEAAHAERAGLTSNSSGKPLHSAFDGVQRPRRPDAHQVTVGVGEVEYLGAEARSGHHPDDPVGLETRDLALDLVRGQLEPHRTAHLAAAVGIPGEDEERLLLQHEEGAVGVLALVIRRRRPVAEQPRVEIDRPVEVGHIEVNGRDEPGHGYFVLRSFARRRSRAFFLRCRSCRHRLRGREPRPTRPGSL